MNVSELLETIEAKIGLMEAQRVNSDRRAVCKEIVSHLAEIRECLAFACGDGKSPGSSLGEESYLPYSTHYQFLSLADQRAYHDLRCRGYECFADIFCCQTCALSAVRGEKYVYWHAQDADIAAQERKLSLGWDGDEIVEVLRAADLEVEWGGIRGRRIVVRLRQEQFEEVAA